MRLSEIIRFARPARFEDKAGASFIGVSNGEDVRLPYVQAGWVNIADGQYTLGSPRVILAGAKTHITIDGAGAATNTTYANGMHSDVWSENRFKPSGVGEAYTLRLTCSIAQTSSGTGHYVTFEADIGTDAVPFVTATESVSLLKGQGVATHITVSAPFFCLEAFGLRGARLFVTPSVDITMWGFAIFIQRTFKP